MLGYIMGNITDNRSPLLRSAVKMKSTLQKSDANEVGGKWVQN